VSGKVQKAVQHLERPLAPLLVLWERPLVPPEHQLAAHPLGLVDPLVQRLPQLLEQLLVVVLWLALRPPLQNYKLSLLKVKANQKSKASGTVSYNPPERVK
jgi:hypothetical protein